MREKSFMTWLWVAVVLVTVANLPTTVSRRVKGVFREVLAPLQMSISSLGRRWSAGWQALRGLNDLAEQNQRMASELVYYAIRFAIFAPWNPKTANCENNWIFCAARNDGCFPVK
jgi:cell shape-determining protein MreC